VGRFRYGTPAARLLLDLQIVGRSPIAGRAADVENLDFISHDRKERPISALAAAEDELANFGVHEFVLRRQLATLRRMGERLQLGFESCQPFVGSLRGSFSRPEVGVAEVLLRAIYQIPWPHFLKKTAARAVGVGHVGVQLALAAAVTTTR